MTDRFHEDARGTQAKLHAARHRTLDDADLGTAPLRTFKADARSHVWLVDAPPGRRVIKRFEYSRLRQRLSLLLGIHPGRRELKCNRRLRAAQVRVVPIVDAGVESRGLGCRAWLATPLTGSSLHHLLDAADEDTEDRGRLIDAAARLAADLIRAGFWFKDLKPSNIVIDESGDAWLIDVGSARPARKPVHTERMLAVMDRVLVRAGADTALRRRFDASVRQSAGLNGAARQLGAAAAR
ncbi:MAG: lipopolysaccharide kinase InaA family protein [Planctomycetota bacterium]|jgi:tRNA A-37 threonylcarbamoyl transferase component Bud32